MKYKNLTLKQRHHADQIISGGCAVGEGKKDFERIRLLAGILPVRQEGTKFILDGKSVESYRNRS